MLHTYKGGFGVEKISVTEQPEKSQLILETKSLTFVLS